MLSLNNKSKFVLLFSCSAYGFTAIGVSVFDIMCGLLGLVVFSHDRLCDPIKDGIVQAKEQVCIHYHFIQVG